MPKYSAEKILGVGVIVTVLATFALSMFILSLQPRMSGYLVETTEKSTSFIFEKIGSYTIDNTEISTFEISFIGESGYRAALSKDNTIQIRMIDSQLEGNVILVDKYGTERIVMTSGGGEQNNPPFTGSIDLDIPTDTLKVRFTIRALSPSAQVEIRDLLSNVEATYSVGYSAVGTLGGGEQN